MPRFLDTVSIKKPKRSSFDLSNRYKFSARIGQLIPAVCIPTLPSDHFSLSAAFQARLSALVNPIYDDITARVEWFFVPNEIIMPYWKAFITGNKSLNDTAIPNGSWTDAVSATLPTVSFLRGYYDSNAQEALINGLIEGQSYEAGELGSALESIDPELRYQWLCDNNYIVFDGSLADYLGIGLATFPTKVSSVNDYTNIDFSSHTYNLLPFLAYQKVFDSYYIYEPTDSDFTTVDLYWKKFFEEGFQPFELSTYERPIRDILSVKYRAWNRDIFTAATHEPVGDEAVKVDTSTGSFTIPQLNLARALYRIFYKDTVGGGRYEENILSQFGILPSAVAMHKPLFLGSQSFKVNVNGVVQTSSTDDVSPQGNMAGLGVGSGETGRISYICHEHGYIIGMFSIMPRSTYAYHTRKDFLCRERFDYPFPDLAGIGDEEILVKEVWDTSTRWQNETFGYQQRFYSYKQILDSVHGGFRNFNGDLGAYTMVRDTPTTNGVSRPSPTSYQLSSAFVRPSSLDSEIDRVFANTDIYESGYHYVADFFADIRANRPLPEYSMPLL